MILPSPPRKPDPLQQLLRRPLAATTTITQDTATVNASLLTPPPKEVLQRIRPLYQLLPLACICDVLQKTRRFSRRQRQLPAQDVVWLVVAQSLYRDRSLPQVWRHLHCARTTPEPDDSAFTHARKRLGAAPLRQLYHQLAAPLGRPGMDSAYHRRWRLFALDGSIFEMADTPANRAHFGSSSNQHKDAAFPQLQALALCEIGTHALIDFAFGPYHDSELALSKKLLPRLPRDVLLLMDRGLSYYEQVRLVVDRDSHVLARVKAEQRTLPVEEVLADGSYRSHIYPSANHRRAGKEGIAVRVIRYCHAKLRSDAGEQESCLITTLLDPFDLSALEAIQLYPWRWQEESTWNEVKSVLLKGKMPLLRSKTPELVEQELYGLLLAHFVVRSVMATAAALAEVEPYRLSFKRSQELLEDHVMEGPGRLGQRAWLKRLVAEVSHQPLRTREARSNPRVKKVTRCKWPGKKATDKGRVRKQPLARVSRVQSVAEAKGAGVVGIASG